MYLCLHCHAFYQLYLVFAIYETTAIADMALSMPVVSCVLFYYIFMVKN